MFLIYVVGCCGLLGMKNIEKMNPKIARSGRKEERSRRASMMTRTGRGGR
jgi:hypothetical protein